MACRLPRRYARQQDAIRESQEKFLEKTITDNSITFNDDKLNRHWTVEYYLENAKLRLSRSIEMCDHYKKTTLHASLQVSQIAGD